MFRRILCVWILLISFSFNAYASSFDASLLHSKAAVLGDYGSGKIIFKQNEDEKLPIASVTKIMTMLLVMEAVDAGKINLGDVVTISETAAKKEGSHIFLAPGEQITVSDLLKGVAVSSGNDAAMALAEFVAGSQSEFVNMMNKRAEELNMNNTHFENCNGLDSDNHFSSAKDVFIMTKELMKHSKIFEYTGIWMDTLRDGKFGLSNTNKLIRFYDGATGMKTGSTSKAGYCLSATAKRNGMHLIAVVLGADSSQHRFYDASTLLNFGFDNYKLLQLAKNGEVAGYCEVEGGREKVCKGVYGKGIEILVQKGNEDTDKKILIEEKTKAPVKKGDVIGKAKFKFKDGNEIEADIVSADNIEKISPFYIFVKIAQNIIL